jgi:hypothetical protein
VQAIAPLDTGGTLAPDRSGLRGRARSQVITHSVDDEEKYSAANLNKCHGDTNEQNAAILKCSSGLLDDNSNSVIPQLTVLAHTILRATTSIESTQESI